MTRLRETRTSDPSVLPVDLQQAKAWLKIEDSDIEDDPVVMGILYSAAERCEKHTGRALITQTWTAYLDWWPRVPSEEYWEGWRQGPESIIVNPAPHLPLNHSPVQSVTSIKTYDDADDATTYAASNYFVDTASEPARIVLRRSAAAPLPTRVANGIEIIYVAGYGDDPADVPETLRQGILAYAAHLYEHRGDEAKAIQLPASVRMLWDAYTVKKLW